MLINITKIQVPVMPKWEIHVGKKHIASICLNGTLVRFDPVLKQNHWDSLSLVVLQRFSPSKIPSDWVRFCTSKPVICRSIAIAICKSHDGDQPKNRNTIFIGSATRHVNILNMHSVVRRELIIVAIPSLVLINQIYNKFSYYQSFIYFFVMF